MTDRTVKGNGPKPAKTTDSSLEAPEADVAEQRRDALDEDDETPSDDEPPYDADPADAAEQRMAVEFDDDEYR